MKFKDFINKEFDLDVCDDYAEDLCIAFCGPAYKMRPAGFAKFSPLFDVDISINLGQGWACLNIANYDDETCEKIGTSCNPILQLASWLLFQRNIR